MITSRCLEEWGQCRSCGSTVDDTRRLSPRLPGIHGAGRLDNPANEGLDGLQVAETRAVDKVPAALALVGAYHDPFVAQVGLPDEAIEAVHGLQWLCQVKGA